MSVEGNNENWILEHCFKRFYLFIFREGNGGRKKETSMWLPLACPLLGTGPETQACAPTGNRTGDSLVPRSMLNPLSYNSQRKYLQILTTQSMCSQMLWGKKWQSLQNYSSWWGLLAVREKGAKKSFWKEE